MSNKKDYYEVLELTAEDKKLNAEEFKKKLKNNYRSLCKKYHPDKNPNNKEAEEKFKLINEANEILSDPEKKQQYDRFGHDGPRQSQGGGFGGFNGFNQDDIFEHFMGGFGGRRQRQNPIKRGSDIRIKVNLTLKEIVTGVHKKVKLNREMSCKPCSGNGSKDGNSFSTCSNCNGTGQEIRVTQTPMGHMQQISPCSICGGSGRQVLEKCKICNGNGFNLKSQEIEFDIIPGAVQDMYFQLEGFGNEARGEGITGNLIVLINEIIDEKLKRKNTDILSDLFISYADAVLGAEGIELKTIDGYVKIKIDPATENGKLLRLKNKGIPNVQDNSKRGDHLVYVNIYIPKNISEEEKNKLRDIQKVENMNPSETKVMHIKGVCQRILEEIELN